MRDPTRNGSFIHTHIQDPEMHSIFGAFPVDYYFMSDTIRVYEKQAKTTEHSEYNQYPLKLICLLLVRRVGDMVCAVFDATINLSRVVGSLGLMVRNEFMMT